MALSERELQVCKLIAAGYSNVQIARALTISPNTVSDHIENIMHKTDSPNRTCAVVTLLINGCLSPASVKSVKNPNFS